MKDFEFNPNGNGSRHAPKNLPDLSVEIVKGLRLSLSRTPKKGVPLWKNLLYILDLVNGGQFTGIISMRVVGNLCYPIRKQEEEINMNELYEEYEERSIE